MLVRLTPLEFAGSEQPTPRLASSRAAKCDPALEADCPIAVRGLAGEDAVLSHDYVATAGTTLRSFLVSNPQGAVHLHNALG